MFEERTDRPETPVHAAGGELMVHAVRWILLAAGLTLALWVPHL